MMNNDMLTQEVVPTNNKRRLFTILSLAALIVAISLLLATAGLNLAGEGTPQENARLIGVFITTDWLDIPSPNQGQPIRVGPWGRPDLSELLRPGRIYAQWCEEAFDFTFPGVEGIPFFAATLPPTYDRSEIVSAFGGSGIRNHGSHFSFGDNFFSAELEGTIYAIPGSLTHVYLNQVFQTSDGAVFIEGSGGGFSYHGTVTEGAVFSSTLAETRTINEFGTEHSYSISVTVNNYAKFPATHAVVLQMDANSQIITRTEVARTEMADGISILPNTAYVIMEIHRDVPPGHGEAIQRELITQDTHGHPVFFAGPGGILEAELLEFGWYYPGN